MAQRSETGSGPGDVDAKLVAAFERLAAALRQQLGAVARSHRLSPLQAQVLSYLAAVAGQNPDGVTLGQVVDTLGLVPGTVSEAITALVRKRLVVREVDPRDRRYVRLRLSKRGEMVAASLAGWTAVLAESLGILTDEEKAQLYRSLLRIVDHLQRRGVIPLQRMCFRCAFFEGPDVCHFLRRRLEPAELQIDCPDFVPAESPDSKL